jgi:hypothetical protein
MELQMKKKLNSLPLSINSLEAKIERLDKKIAKMRDIAEEAVQALEATPDVSQTLTCLYHQISFSLGGCFIYKQQLNAGKSLDLPMGPYDIFSMDELIKKFGSEMAIEMATACRDYGVEEQIAIAIDEIRANGYTNVSPIVKKTLKSEGIDLDRLTKVKK